MTGIQEHLTDRELDALLMGAEETVFESVRKLHLRDCGTCRARLTEMRALTESFRDGVMLWGATAAAKTTADATAAPGVLRSAQDGGKKRYGWRIVPAMGLAGLLVVGALTPHWVQQRRAAEMASRQTAQARQAAADAALMQQVQQQLDESVPESMAPLTVLIQTENPHRTTGQAKEN